MKLDRLWHARIERPPLTPAMQDLERMGYVDLAAYVSSTEGRKCLRNVWSAIDQAVGEEGKSGERIFAGIMHNGTRYIEVYGRGGLYDVDFGPSVLVASADLMVGDGITLTPGERRAGTRNGEVPVFFSDPTASYPRQRAELRLRPVRYGGTSSYFAYAHDAHAYGGEVFPMAPLQVLADFDPEAPRLSLADTGAAGSYSIKINAPQYTQHPQSDIDDIAV